MRILVCDTSNSTCCAGIYDIELAGTDLDISEIAYEVSFERRTHSEVIMPLVSKVMEDSGTTHEEIDSYAVTIGPGSFTGIRIGISAVKGMAAVTGKDVIPVSSTEALARSVEILPYDGGTIIIAAFDARNKRVFASVFDEERNIIIEENAYSCDMLAERIVPYVKEGMRVIVCGNGFAPLNEELTKAFETEGLKNVTIEDASGAAILPKGIARSCLASLQKHKENAIVSALKLVPKYCARSQAERFKKPLEYEIEEASLEDTGSIMVIEAEGIDHPWEKSAIDALVNDDGKISVIAREKGSNAVLGYVGASYVIDEAEVGNLCVSGRFRRLGLGVALMTELMNKLRDRGAKTLFLEVRSNNYPAISLYEKLGFETVSVRKDYYGPQSDAVVMKIEL